MDAFFSGCAAPLLSRFWDPGEDDRPPAVAAGALKTGGQFCCGPTSVQRNPDSEEPEAPSAEYRVEHRCGVVAVVREWSKVALRVADIACRAVPARVPASGRGRSVPASGRRGPVPVGWWRTGRRSTVPAESARWRRRRRTVVRCTEAVRRVVGATPFGATAVVETVLDVRRWWRSTGTTRSAGAMRSRSARTAGVVVTRSSGATGSTRSAGVVVTRSSGRHQVRRGCGHQVHRGHRDRQGHRGSTRPTGSTGSTGPLTPRATGPTRSLTTRTTRFTGSMSAAATGTLTTRTTRSSATRSSASRVHRVHPGQRHQGHPGQRHRVRPDHQAHVRRRHQDRPAHRGQVPGPGLGRGHPGRRGHRVRVDRQR